MKGGDKYWKKVRYWDIRGNEYSVWIPRRVK